MPTLPNFLIIGAQKAGTTALYYMLNEHPEIFMSPIKEPNYFALKETELNFNGRGDSEHINKGRFVATTDYLALFDGSGEYAARGEASTSYLWSESAPGRIREEIPAAKLIAILRDPVERAYSEYKYWRRDDREPDPNFESAFAAEDSTERANWWIGHYRRNGLYCAQLRRYLEHFPRQQLRIYLYEDFRGEPLSVTKDIFEFLDVSPEFTPAVDRQHNISGEASNVLLHNAYRFLLKPNLVKNRILKPLLPRGFRRRMRENAMDLIRNRNLKPQHLDRSVRRRLLPVFEDEIRDLERLLDRDLSSWRTA